jgi:toxin ParE1/3/4
MNRRYRSRRKSQPLSPPRKLPLPVANLRPMSRCGRCGPNTVCEAALHPSGPCRPQLLDYIAAAAGRTAGSGPARIQAFTDLLLLHPHIGRRTNDPAIRRMTTTPLPLSGFLRGHRDRDHHSRRAACGAQSVRNARHGLINISCFDRRAHFRFLPSSILDPRGAGLVLEYLPPRFRTPRRTWRNHRTEGWRRCGPAGVRQARH